MMTMNLSLRAVVATLIAGAIANVPAHAQTPHRCLVNGQTVFQDRPCAEQQPTGSQLMAQRARQLQQIQRLDELQAQGVGLLNTQAQPDAAPRESPVKSDRAESTGPRRPQVGRHGSEWYHQQALAELDRRNAESRTRNERTADRLSDAQAQAAQACGGPLKAYATVGMSDEKFRTCTQQGRFGGATQIVAVDDHGAPLRLYVYPRAPAQRVYSVSGVVVAVRP